MLAAAGDAGAVSRSTAAAEWRRSAATHATGRAAVAATGARRFVRRRRSNRRLFYDNDGALNSDRANRSSVLPGEFGSRRYFAERHVRPAGTLPVRNGGERFIARQSIDLCLLSARIARRDWTEFAEFLLSSRPISDGRDNRATERQLLYRRERPAGVSSDARPASLMPAWICRQSCQHQYPQRTKLRQLCLLPHRLLLVGERVCAAAAAATTTSSSAAACLHGRSVARGQRGMLPDRPVDEFWRVLLERTVTPAQWYLRVPGR